MESYTCSFSYGNSALNHVLRGYEYTLEEQKKGRLKNVNIELTKENIILKNCESIEKEFNETFKEYVKEYNQKQKREDRKINNYYQKVKNLKKRSDGSSQMKTDYEYVVQFGNKDNHPDKKIIFNGKEYKVSVAMLFSVFKKLEKQKNIHINYAAIHVDEDKGTPHLHINLTPLAFDYSRGMSVRPAIDRAFQQMFKLDNRQFAYKKFLN